MTIITKPSLVTKNESAEFTLNKTELSNHASVVGNTYFHDTTNWKEVIMKFTSTTGNQIEVLVFDATLASPTANFLVSDKARNGFEINHITIMDHDGGSLHIGQMDLNLPDFDVAVSDPSAPPSASYARDFASPSTLLSYEQTVNTFGVGEGFLQIGGSGAQYINNAPEISLIEGNVYELRLYPIYVAQGLSPSVGGVALLGFDYGALSSAIGSYVSVSFTATAGQAASLTKIQISPSSFSFYVQLAKIELLPL